MHLNDAIIYGVPSVVDENVRSILSQISNAIGFAATDIYVSSIFRATRVRNAPIIVKFISGTVRSDFLRLYMKRKTNPLSLMDVGFKTKERIFIRESLCPTYAALFRKAMQFKKDGLIDSVFTQNGFVKLRVNARGDLICIRNTQHLMDIVSSISNVNTKRKLNNSSSNDFSIVSDPKHLKTVDNMQNRTMLFSTPSRADVQSLSSSTSSLFDSPATVVMNSRSTITRQLDTPRPTLTGTLDNFVLHKQVTD